VYIHKIVSTFPVLPKFAESSCQMEQKHCRTIKWEGTSVLSKMVATELEIRYAQLADKKQTSILERNIMFMVRQMDILKQTPTR